MPVKWKYTFINWLTNMKNFKLALEYGAAGYVTQEYIDIFDSYDEAFDEGNDIAFESTGFSLECWKKIDFGKGNRIYFFYPNEGDLTSRYKMTFMEAK